MARPRLLRDLTVGPRPGRRTVRVRLTVLYCCLFFPSAVVLVLLTYIAIVLIERPRFIEPSAHTSRHGASITGGPTPHIAHADSSQGATAAPVHVDLVGHEIALSGGQFLAGSCIVLIAMIGLSVLLGWFAAGRILRPLRVITSTTRQISERNLHERLALAGPDDELKDLGETIDGLLARLEAAFDSQRRFVANASHELRTPLMLSQTLLQVALADPAITLDSLRAACQEAIDAGKDQAQLIDALLTLARSQRGLDHREPVDLATTTQDVLSVLEPIAIARGIRVDTALGRTEVSGDAVLIHRLVSNLLDNAIRYNLPGGQVEIALAADATETTLTVANTGPPVPPDQIGRLLEPFQRAAADRTAGPNGLGLGLSIVAQIAEAHGAGLGIHPRAEGGLTVTVSFPATTAPGAAPRAIT